MSLFGTTKEIAPTGTDVLREALRARIHKAGYVALLARDLNIGIAALDEFAHGKGKLPDAIMSALAKAIFGDNAGYDPETNLLKRTPPPSTVLRSTAPTRAPVVTPPRVSKWPPNISDTPQPQPKGRAGWAD